MAEEELDGKVAVVTGAARNIGRAIALELAAAGATIVVNARASKADAEAVAHEIQAGGGRALAVLADVTDEAAVARMASAGVERFGRIDILVNNAAVRREQALDELSLAAWREILGIILDGAFICAKACLPHLRASGAGAIVNIGGLTAHLGAARRAHVVTAKAGLVGLTRALAHDLAADNVTMNCVSPGRIATVRTAPEPKAHRVSSLTGEPRAPQDIATAVRFLCGPGARYISGQTIQVNGGAYLA